LNREKEKGKKKKKKKKYESTCCPGPAKSSTKTLAMSEFEAFLMSLSSSTLPSQIQTQSPSVAKLEKTVGDPKFRLRRPREEEDQETARSNTTI